MQYVHIYEKQIKPAKYGKEPLLLVRQLVKLGCTFDTKPLCTFISELAALDFQLEIQIDHLLDGSLRKTFNLSVNITGKPQAIRKSFAEGQGAALVKLLQSWGMADERAKQIGKTAFSAVIPNKVFSNMLGYTGIVVKPAFIKTVWNDGQPQTAKVYVECLTF